MKYILPLLYLALVFCPAKYDPAIRLAEFNEKWARRLKERSK